MTKNELLLRIAIRATSYYNGSEFKTRRLIEGYEKYIEEEYGVKYPTEDYIESLINVPDEEFEKMSKEEQKIIFDKMHKIEKEVFGKWDEAIDKCISDSLILLKELIAKVS